MATSILRTNRPGGTGEGESMEQRVIVRTYSAGVFFGNLTNRSEEGKRGEIKNARLVMTDPWKHGAGKSGEKRGGAR